MKGTSAQRTEDKWKLEASSEVVCPFANKFGNSPNDKSPLFSILNFIVLGMETRLVVALNVFFFFGFSISA